MVSDTPRLPPQNLDAEMWVLGACLLENSAVATAQTILRESDFCRAAHRKIFHAIGAVCERGEPADNLTVTAQLAATGELTEVGGAAYLAELVAAVPSSSNIEYHAKLVKDSADRRAIIAAADRLQTLGYDSEHSTSELLAEAERTIFTLTCGAEQSGFLPAYVVVAETTEEVRRRSQRTGTVTGLSTGFQALDEITAGLQPSDLVVIAARPSMGKTSLAFIMALRATLKYNASIGFFSLEMSRQQLMTRGISVLAEIDVYRLRNGRLTIDEVLRFEQAAQRLKESRLFINDTAGLTLQRLRGESRRLKMKHGLDLIVIDYLQLLTGRNDAESRQQEISEISRGLKILAKELNVPVLCLSQLNRACEARNDKRPLLSDLRDSGAIEQDADICMFLYRDEVYESPDRGLAELLIKKHRSGPIGTVILRFEERFARFSDNTSLSATTVVDLAR